jgi:hypothetical protein
MEVIVLLLLIAGLVLFLIAAFGPFSFDKFVALGLACWIGAVIIEALGG